MRPDLKKLALLLAAVLIAAIVVAGCGGGGSSSSGSTEAETTTEAEPEGETEPAAEETEEGEEGGATALGKPDKATGSPIVFGMLNLENGPVTFPQSREGAEAAIEYVNNYKGGIQGHPIELVECATDGQPATSTRCANQIVEKNPLLILGGADTGAAGAFPVYERKHLAYVGGLPLTPVESNAKNGSIFISVSVGDNIAMVAYAKDELGLKSGVVLQTGDTQGKYSGEIISSAMEGAGMSTKVITVSPTASDLSAPAAEAVSSGAEFIYIETPNECAAMMKALESVGNTATVAAVGTCSAPSQIEAAGPAAEGVYFPEPTELLSSESEDAAITNAAFEEFASAEMPRESIAIAGFGAIMNISEVLGEAPAADLENPAKIQSLFSAGSEHPNWMAHPFTCDRKQVPSQEAVCNGYQQINKVNGGQFETVSKEWVTGVKYFHPPSH
jgi:branched-chain amino acid transport system substrate-binding protein